MNFIDIPSQESTQHVFGGPQAESSVDVGISVDIGTVGFEGTADSIQFVVDAICS